MTTAKIDTPEKVAKIANSIIPVPAERAGSWVALSCVMHRFSNHIVFQGGGDGGNGGIPGIKRGRVREWADHRHRRRVFSGEPDALMIEGERACYSMSSRLAIAFSNSGCLLRVIIER
jgi:hypothetical protein